MSVAQARLRLAPGIDVLYYPSDQVIPRRLYRILATALVLFVRWCTMQDIEESVKVSAANLKRHGH